MPCCLLPSQVARVARSTGTPRHGKDAARFARNRNCRRPEDRSPTRCRALVDPVVHVIIMPGFLIPSDAPTYQRLGHAIDDFLSKHQRAHTVDVVPMGLFDWLKIALLGNDFRDYLDRAADLIDSFDQNDSVVIVGHSAGGWVARLLLGAETVTYNGWSRPGLRQRVRRLVTLGTPHYSKEAYPFGRVKERVYSGAGEGGSRVFDSSLAFTNEFFGTAADLAPTDVVSFLGVIDDAGEPTLLSRVSYAANAGDYAPGMRGDGVVPMSVAGTFSLSFLSVVHLWVKTRSMGQDPKYGSSGLILSSYPHSIGETVSWRTNRTVRWSEAESPGVPSFPIPRMRG